MSTTALSKCPFCGGVARLDQTLRDGYQKCQEDEDAWAHFVICNSCAAQGGWAKSQSGAIRWWNTRKRGKP